MYCCPPLDFLCTFGNGLESERNGKIINNAFLHAQEHTQPFLSPLGISPAALPVTSGLMAVQWGVPVAAVSRAEVLWWDWKSSSVCAACMAAEPRALCWGRATTAAKLPASLPVQDRFSHTLTGLSRVAPPSNCWQCSA